VLFVSHAWAEFNVQRVKWLPLDSAEAALGSAGYAVVVKETLGTKDFDLVDKVWIDSGGGQTAHLRWWYRPVSYPNVCSLPLGQACESLTKVGFSIVDNATDWQQGNRRRALRLVLRGPRSGFVIEQNPSPGTHKGLPPLTLTLYPIVPNLVSLRMAQLRKMLSDSLGMSLSHDPGKGWRLSDTVTFRKLVIKGDTTTEVRRQSPAPGQPRAAARVLTVLFERRGPFAGIAHAFDDHPGRVILLPVCVLLLALVALLLTRTRVFVPVGTHIREALSRAYRPSPVTIPPDDRVWGDRSPESEPFRQLRLMLDAWKQDPTMAKREMEASFPDLSANLTGLLRKAYLQIRGCISLLTTHRREAISDDLKDDYTQLLLGTARTTYAQLRRELLEPAQGGGPPPPDDLETRVRGVLLSDLSDESSGLYWALAAAVARSVEDNVGREDLLVQLLPLVARYNRIKGIGAAPMLNEFLSNAVYVNATGEGADMSNARSPNQSVYLTPVAGGRLASDLMMVKDGGRDVLVPSFDAKVTSGNIKVCFGYMSEDTRGLDSSDFVLLRPGVCARRQEGGGGWKLVSPGEIGGPGSDYPSLVPYYRMEVRLAVFEQQLREARAGMPPDAELEPLVREIVRTELAAVPTQFVPESGVRAIPLSELTRASERESASAADQAVPAPPKLAQPLRGDEATPRPGRSATHEENGRTRPGDRQDRERAEPAATTRAEVRSTTAAREVEEPRPLVEPAGPPRADREQVLVPEGLAPKSSSPQPGPSVEVVSTPDEGQPSPSTTEWQSNENTHLTYLGWWAKSAGVDPPECFTRNRAVALTRTGGTRTRLAPTPAGNFWVVRLQNPAGDYVYPHPRDCTLDDLATLFDLPAGFSQDLTRFRLIKPARVEAQADGAWIVVEKGSITQA
jgi:hypothetical protein